MRVCSASPAVFMAGDVLSVDSFVERVFDRSPKFPRRFSHDDSAVEGAGGGREGPSHCAYMLPSSLDKIVDEDTMAREQEESQLETTVVTANRGKGALRFSISTAGGGGKESGSRRRSTSDSPHSEWGVAGSGCRSRGDCLRGPGYVWSGSVWESKQVQLCVVWCGVCVVWCGVCVVWCGVECGVVCGGGVCVCLCVHMVCVRSCLCLCIRVCVCVRVQYIHHVCMFVFVLLWIE